MENCKSDTRPRHWQESPFILCKQHLHKNYRKANKTIDNIGCPIKSANSVMPVNYPLQVCMNDAVMST